MKAPAFRGRELMAALLTAGCAQGVFLLVFSASPPDVRAEQPPARTREVAVSVTPVGLPKLGGGHKGRVRTRAEDGRPSPAAVETTAGRIHVSQADPGDSSAALGDAGAEPAEASAAPEGEGSPDGIENGTETDPLRAHAVAAYRGQLASWFLSRFSIRGKIPFETLERLHAVASITVNADRSVGGYSVVSSSGNATFDREVRETLAGIQASGASLPAPPPMYPNLLGKTLSVSFRCSVRSQCE